MIPPDDRHSSPPNGGDDFQFDLGFNAPVDFDLPPPDVSPPPPARPAAPIRVVPLSGDSRADESHDDVPVGEGYRRTTSTLQRVTTLDELKALDPSMFEEGGPEDASPEGADSPPSIERALAVLGISGDAVANEGDHLRLFCPIHRDQVRRSLRIDLDTGQFRCQFKQCPGHAGGDMAALVALTLGVTLSEARTRLTGAKASVGGASACGLVERAQAHIDRLEYDSALPLLRRAVEESPRDEVTRCRLASLLLETGRRDEGIQNYLVAAEDYGCRGELAKTLHIYKLLVLVDPNDLAVHEQMAYIAARLGDEDDAINRFAWIVDQYIERSEFENALMRVEHLLQLRPESADFILLKADLLVSNGLDKQCSELVAFEVQRAVARNDLETALRLANKGMEIFPANALLLHLRDEVANELRTRGDDPEIMTAQMRRLEEDEEEAGSAEDDDFRQWIEDLEKEIQPLEARARAVEEAGDINTEDERVLFCRDNLRGFDSPKMLKMYRHLRDMYKDVRESFDRGELSDFEKKVIKDFYTSFCIAFKEYNKEVTGDSMLTKF
jgi:tetratricopeptide (TPR) repeat protein